MKNDIVAVKKTLDELQIDCIQLFLEPLYGISFKRKLHYRAVFRELKKSSYISTIFLHAPDSVSLRESKNGSTIPAWKRIRERLHEADDIGADGLIVHVNVSIDFPINRIREEMESVFFDFHCDAKLLLENVTIKNSIGSDLQLFQEIIQSLSQAYPTYVCLDTAHLYEVGYSFRNKDEMKKLVNTFPIIFQNTRLVHLNDSKTEKGSYLDHHAPLGEGFIGSGALGAVVSVFPTDMFYIAELPKSESERLKENVEILRQIVNGNKNKLDEIKPNSKIEKVFYF